MISGANRGIGEALARALHEDGWALSLGARDTNALEESVSQYRSGGAPKISLHAFDATDIESTGNWVEETIEQHGRIDCLINNAGIAIADDLVDLTEEVMDQMWEVNAKAPFRLIRHTLPYLRASGEGRIVNVISMSGKRVKGTFAPGYAMSKHAAMALHHSVRHGTFGDGIRCTALCPGYVATEMTADFGVDQATMIHPSDLAAAMVTLLRLPNSAHVAELLVTNEPETIA